MRRTFSLIVVAAGVAALAGTSSAGVVPRDPEPVPVATAPAPAPERAPTVTVGALETVSRLLTYAERRTAIRYPGADYVKVHFARMLLLPGDYVTVADAGGREVHRYRGQPLELLESTADRWAMSVTGDTAVVTLHSVVPDPLGLRQRGGTLGVQVDRVARGYTPKERNDRRTGREESLCGGDDKADAVCYRSTNRPVFDRSRAVARLLINGTELCTGWRIGPQNRMLTNHHCFHDSDDAYNTEVWFNYRCAECGGFDVVRPTKVWGEKVLASDADLDFTLFTLDGFEQVTGFGHLELDNRRAQPGEQVYIPQHPGGDPTMVAVASDTDRGGVCQIQEPAVDGYRSGSDATYFCDTEGGSSGSPVLSARTHKVVALHHFGGCPNAGVRSDLLYAELAHLL